MRKFTPSPGSASVCGRLSFLGATIIAVAGACNPVAPLDDDLPANRGQGGSAAANPGGSGGTNGGSPSQDGFGVASLMTCSSPMDMKGVSAADFCAQYMSTCQYGAAAPKYTSVDDCKARYGGYTGEQKWCVAYHLCKAAENNGATKDTHCPHTTGGGGDPCKLAASSAPDGGAAGGPDAQAAAPSLKTDIYPLFAARCQSCHMDLVKSANDLYKWLTDNAARMACATATMPRKAVILSKTNPDPNVATACGAKMPPSSKGDPDVWAKLKAWVADGAKNN